MLNKKREQEMVQRNEDNQESVLKKKTLKE